jgi:hypothetical protein
MTDEFFDYASIMLKMDRLNKDIHDCLLHGRIKESLPLTKELLVQTRFLQLWVTQEIERRSNDGHRNHRL